MLDSNDSSDDSFDPESSFPVEQPDEIEKLTQDILQTQPEAREADLLTIELSQSLRRHGFDMDKVVPFDADSLFASVLVLYGVPPMKRMISSLRAKIAGKLNSFKKVCLQTVAQASHLSF